MTDRPVYRRRVKVGATIRVGGVEVKIVDADRSTVRVEAGAAVEVLQSVSVEPATVEPVPVSC